MKTQTKIKNKIRREYVAEKTNNSRSVAEGSVHDQRYFGYFSSQGKGGGGNNSKYQND